MAIAQLEGFKEGFISSTSLLLQFIRSHSIGYCIREIQAIMTLFHNILNNAKASYLIFVVMVYFLME